MFSLLPLVAQLGMSSCSVAGENEGLWGEASCWRLLKTSVCFQLASVVMCVYVCVRQGENEKINLTSSVKLFCS